MLLLCPLSFPLLVSYLYTLLLGLPLGLKVPGPWAHHTEEVCVIDKKKKKSLEAERLN